MNGERRNVCVCLCRYTGDENREEEIEKVGGKKRREKGKRREGKEDRREEGKERKTGKKRKGGN